MIQYGVADKVTSSNDYLLQVADKSSWKEWEGVTDRNSWKEYL